MKSLLAPIAACFRLGAAARARAYSRGWLSNVRVGRPVISVGNLSVGGTGKTPMVASIAQTLAARGLRPSILTRGYGRAAGDDPVVIPPGANRLAEPRKAGDEPALLARIAPAATILVSSNRVRAARLAEEQFHVDVHVLDDGFQHFAIERDLDIVLIDVTQELSKGEVLPAGRLREAPEALSRADMIVLTRTELAHAAPLETQFRAINPHAPLFQCSTKLYGFVDLLDGGTRPIHEILEKPVMAICGVGNPRAFFANLRQWGVNVAAEESFRDHHVYTREDLRRILKHMKQIGTAALVMTEKDAVNFPRQEITDRDLLLAACSIRLEVSNATLFEEKIMNAAVGRRLVA